MRLSSSLLSLVLLFSGPMGQAQQSAGSKAKVYAAYLRRELYGVDSLSSQVDHQVMLIPATKSSCEYLKSHCLAPLMKPRRPTEAVILPDPEPGAEGKAALQPQPSFESITRQPHDDFNDWLWADTARADMGRRFDALNQQTQFLPERIEVPSYHVLFESADYLATKRYQDYLSQKHKKNRAYYAVIELSDVVFSPDGRYAVFYVGVYPGSLGSGTFAFMEHTAQGWHKKFTAGGWIEL